MIRGGAALYAHFGKLSAGKAWGVLDVKATIGVGRRFPPAWQRERGPLLDCWRSGGKSKEVRGHFGR
jgi:hypothetical protein